jgi:hypothetical protein
MNVAFLAPLDSAEQKTLLELMHRVVAAVDDTES